ncbi:uncharacterized protein LOC118228207 [Anguilla anguilla]|uniref:uncharacterized protein LOC118228207 n=1 Tax=Anguilla anguilla TaxID=7936 RepID=UPI0015A9A637|nr:uncharacterized protein LOC118228207 [Anguilla anguilla]
MTAPPCGRVEMWRWKRPGFEQTLLGELQRQQRRSLFCDTLLQAEGISVPAHSCVLAALSPALAQVLCSGPAPPPGRSRLLELQAVGAEPLLRLVGFLYSGRLQGEGPAEREELLQAAASLAKSCSPTATESRGGAVLSSGGGAVLSSGGGAVLSSGGVAVLRSGGGAVLDSGGRAVLSSGGGARQGWGGDRAEQREQGGGARQGWGGDRAEQCDHGGSLSPGSSCFLIPSCTVRGNVGRMRSRGMKGRARQRDRRISIKIRLRRQSSGELWEIVSVREEGAVSTPRGGHSSSRGWGLRHRQNQPTLSRLARSKDGLPEVKRPSGLSVGSALPQRICRGLSLTPPSTMTSPPTHTHLPPPHRPVPLQHIHPAHNPVPLPPAPPIPEDSDEQIEKLLDDIMMGLNILPPIVVETDAGGHGDSRILEPSPGAFGTGASGPCPYQCPQITESPRPKNRLMCSRTQDGPFPTNRQSRYISSHETTYPRVPQQASDELHILDRFLFSRENHADGAWERSALGHSDGGGAVTSGDLGSLTQPGAGTGGHPATSITPATSAISKAPSVPAAQSTLGHSSSPWRELRIPEFLSPPPPIRFRMDELRLPDCLSPLGAEAGLPPSASPPSGPAPLPPQPLPPWLCPFPVPLHVLSTPLPDGLQVPSSLCPPKRRRGQHGSPRGVARGGRTGAVEEAGRRKIVTRGLPLDERRKRKGWKEEESEEQRSRKKRKQAVSHGGIQKMGRSMGGASYVGRGRGGANKVRKSDVCADQAGGALPVKQQEVCLQRVRPTLSTLSCTPGPEGPPKRGRGRPPKKRKLNEETTGPVSILAPGGSVGQVGEHGHKSQRKWRRVIIPSSQTPSMRTPKSRACWEDEPGTPLAVAQLSSIYGEEEREGARGKKEAGGERDVEENEGEQTAGEMGIVQRGEMSWDGVMEERREGRMEDPDPQRSRTDGGVEENCRTGGGRANDEEEGGGAELGVGEQRTRMRRWR